MNFLGDDKIVLYQDLENIYVLCMRQVIKTAAENAWGGTKEGAFKTFKKYDKENTQKVNEENVKNNKKKIVDITSKAKSFDKFDFQACNNTLAHLEPMREKINKYYKLSDNDSQNYPAISLQLSDIRNKLAHPDPDEPASKVVERQTNSINYMNVMFGLGFANVLNQDGISYYEIFRQNYIEYINQQLQRWYYLSDFLDIEHYDISSFLDVCVTNDIKVTKKDGKYLFCSSNLQKTVDILKNNLAKNGDVIAEEAEKKTVSAPIVLPKEVSPAQEQPKENKKLFYIILISAAAVILAIAVLVAVILSGRDKPSDSDLASTSVSETSSETSSFQMSSDAQEITRPASSVAQSSQPTVAPPASVPSASSQAPAPQPTQSAVVSSQQTPAVTMPSGPNQILPEHEQEITALQYSSDLALSNKTLTIKVGEYVTPPPANIWTGIKIYSQNTNIAIGEGVLVKGVSPGTTYIIVEEKLGLTSAFRVIVE